MAEHLVKNWMVYVLLGGFIWFVTAMIIASRKQEKKEQDQNKPQGSK